MGFRDAARRLPIGVPQGVATRCAVALVALALAACAAPVPLDAPAVAELPAPIPEWIRARATETDDGRRFVLPVSGSLAVALRAPSAAGLGWVVTESPSGLVATGRFTGPVWPAGAPISRVSPAPVWQVFVFEARAPGAGRLRFELRGGELLKSEPPRSVTLQVDVPPS
jgi:hypothetical protein